MGRRKGSKNNKSVIDPLHTVMTNNERIEFLANLIANRIEKDQASGRRLLEKIEV